MLKVASGCLQLKKSCMCL